MTTKKGNSQSHDYLSEIPSLENQPVLLLLIQVFLCCIYGELSTMKQLLGSCFAVFVCAFVVESRQWQDLLQESVNLKDFIYSFDISTSLGRQFDGIGGLSGGGVIFLCCIIDPNINILQSTTIIGFTRNICFLFF